MCLVDEAYAAKAMPDLGLEIEDSQAQTWRIEHWSQQPKRIVGPEFSCGGHKWFASVSWPDPTPLIFFLPSQADTALPPRECKWTAK